MAKVDDKADVWMPLYIGDYLADTSRLTTEQHGAYMLLIMDYWRNGPPPDEKIVLQQVTRLTDFLFKKHWPVLQKFFTLIDGHWHHKRIDAEKAEALAGKAGASEKARNAAKARWAKSDAPSIPQADAPDVLEECPSPSPSPSPTDTVKTYGPNTVGATAYAGGSNPPSVAVGIAKALREWERARGKFPRNITPSQEQVIELAALAPTPDELRKAYELAVEARENASDAAPINAAFVRAKLEQLRRPPKKREPSIPLHAMTDKQLDALCVELGIRPSIAGESRDVFLARIREKQTEIRGRAA